MQDSTHSLLFAQTHLVLQCGPVMICLSKRMAKLPRTERTAITHDGVNGVNGENEDALEEERKGEPMGP